MQIEIAIENGRSLKLRQTRQADALTVASHSIDTKREAFGPLPDPLMGLKEGTGRLGNE